MVDEVLEGAEQRGWQRLAGSGSREGKRVNGRFSLNFFAGGFNLGFGHDCMSCFAGGFFGRAYWWRARWSAILEFLAVQAISVVQWTLVSIVPLLI